MKYRIYNGRRVRFISACNHVTVIQHEGGRTQRVSSHAVYKTKESIVANEERLKVIRSFDSDGWAKETRFQKKASIRFEEGQLKG
jgi:hypothetical protein